ncbi:hypothetical protein CURTO8I2_170240 [Curtobacterium sp. 8I-2]|nr:hypothetical protein CURTO8I2_170240 [Curtobacterium sp. 8I-2]
MGRSGGQRRRGHPGERAGLDPVGWRGDGLRAGAGLRAADDRAAVHPAVGLVARHQLRRRPTGAPPSSVGPAGDRPRRGAAGRRHPHRHARAGDHGRRRSGRRAGARSHRGRRCGLNPGVF